jgi:hypothetical protein
VVGPIGMVAGAVVGGVAGAMAGAVLDVEDERTSAHDHELDVEIGVIDGDIGAATPDAPPARRGAYSASSSGAGGGGAQPSEGPMQDVDE